MVNETIVKAIQRMESSNLKVMKIDSNPTIRPETNKVVENGLKENSILIFESKLNFGFKSIF